MKKLESFLSSGIYIFLIFLITFISWSFYQDTPPHIINIYSMIGILVLVLINTLILVMYENTLYTVPIILSFLFIINKSGIPLDSFSQLSFFFITLAIFLIGPIIHFIRFKPKMRRKHFFLGYLLIAISFLMPIIYLPFSFHLLLVSLAGVFYLGLYVFYSNTMKGNLNYLFKIMMYVNLLLTAQVFFFYYQGFLMHPELDFFHRIYAGWDRTFGWGNVNSICFYISLTFPSYLYYIFKRPKTYLLWFITVLPLAAILLTQSRGGMLGFVIAVIGVVAFFILKGNKKHFIHGLVFLSVSAIVFYIGRHALYLWWDFFLESIGNDLNDFSSGRLAIYQQGFQIFKQYPLFGGGWIAIKSYYPELFMFHDTFVQVLATTGLFGLFAVGVQYFQIGTLMFKKITLEKSLFLIGFVATQIHGLVENVQFAIPYSIIIVLILSIFETAEKQTIFESIKHRYHYLEV